MQRMDDQEALPAHPQEEATIPGQHLTIAWALSGKSASLFGLSVHQTFTPPQVLAFSENLIQGVTPQFAEVWVTPLQYFTFTKDLC